MVEILIAQLKQEDEDCENDQNDDMIQSSHSTCGSSPMDQNGFAIEIQNAFFTFISIRCRIFLVLWGSKPILKGRKTFKH